MGKRPRAQCPICGRSVALRANDELRDHQGIDAKVTTITGRSAYAWCPGSGQRVLFGDRRG